MSLHWTNAALEPKRKFRYLITFTGADLTDFQFLAQTCDRPGVKLGMSEHKYFNKSFYHPGRVTWDPNPLTIKLVDIQKTGDVSTIDTNRSLLAVFLKSGLSGLINADGSVVTVGKQAAVNALGNVNIRVLNSALTALPENATDSVNYPASVEDTGVAEQWMLKNAYLESIKPDALDYGSEDILTVTIALRYDWAEFKAQRDEQSVNPFGS
jgi:hypothetical protein